MASVKEPNGEPSVMESMTLLRNSLVNAARSHQPWWKSGSACLSALFWVSFVILGLTLAFDQVEPTVPFGFVSAFFFVVAFISSVISSQEGKSG